MTQRANILQELNELGSTCLTTDLQNIYAVPAGYFDGLPEQMMKRIHAKNELAELSSLANSISKETPFSIPAGYFNGLEERLMQSVRASADYQSAKEELETISPLLSGLKKETPYRVPQRYFEQLGADVKKPEVKIISITHRKWFRYAAAAVFIGVIATVTLTLNKNKSIDPNKNPAEWVAKNVKKLNTDQLDEFIKLADEENNLKGSVATKTERSDDIRELMKDVSDNEIRDFLNETSVLSGNSLLN
jgi:hypothetical protein